MLTKRQKTSSPNGQLALMWEEASDAQPETTQGSDKRMAAPRPQALAPSLMEAVVSAHNMRQALKRVKANKGSPGVDGMTVHELPTWLRDNWLHVREQLLNGSYKPQPVRRVELPKPDGGVRLLGIPTVLDRLIQQALQQVLTPQYDPTFSPSSFGFRPGRGARQALAKAQEHLAAGFNWVVDLDLEKFFDRVNHDLLMGRLAQRITDRRVLRLIRRYLEAGVLLNGVVVRSEEGTPQGGPLSPLLANILLDDLDKELERRGHRFCRYADDCNIYVQSRRAGQRVMSSLTCWLEAKLKLKVNQAKSAVDRPFRRSFLGLSVCRRNRGVALSISRKSRKRFEQKVREITRRNRGRSLATILKELATYTDGWVVYYCLARTPSVFEDYDEWLRHRVRCYIWKQWKWPKKRYRELRKAGVEHSEARKTACGHRGLWAASFSPAVNRALPNDVLRRMGYHSLLERYKALAPA